MVKCINIGIYNHIKVIALGHYNMVLASQLPTQMYEKVRRI